MDLRPEAGPVEDAPGLSPAESKRPPRRVAEVRRHQRAAPAGAPRRHGRAVVASGPVRGRGAQKAAQANPHHCGRGDRRRPGGMVSVPETLPGRSEGGGIVPPDQQGRAARPAEQRLGWGPCRVPGCQRSDTGGLRRVAPGGRGRGAGWQRRGRARKRGRGAAACCRPSSSSLRAARLPTFSSAWSTRRTATFKPR